MLYKAKRAVVKLLCAVFGHDYQYTRARIVGHSLPNFVCRRCDKGVNNYDDSADFM